MHIVQDLRYAWRSIVRMPILALVVVGSLAFGIGANTAVFSWVQELLIRPLPAVSNVNGIYLVEPRAETGTYPGASWLEYLDLRERMRSFQDLFAFRMSALSVGEPGQVERAYAFLVSGNYFTALGLTPAVGRFFQPAEARVGSEPVVVISHDYWQNRFGADPAAIGSRIRVNGKLLTIIGVAPAGFQGTALMLAFDLYIPATLAPDLFAQPQALADRSLRGYSVLGRLRASTTARQAQADADETMRQLARAYPETNATMRAEVLAFWQAPRGPQRMFGGAILTLQAIMLILLAAVCGNTANLMLARASTRAREVGVRLALGTPPGRIVRLLLTENVVLALTGALLGAAVATWATRAMLAVPVIGAFPIKFQTRIDAGALAFAVLLGILCGLTVGLAPALRLARLDPQAALRSGARDAGRSRARNMLMAVQVALALLLLMAGGLFLRSFADTRGVDPGFRREGVLLAAYDFGGRNIQPPAAREFARRLLDRLRAVPAVESAAIATSVPLDLHGLPQASFTIDGRSRREGVPYRAITNNVTPGYFHLMGIPLAAGSDFADLSETAAPPQAIVNEAFVQQLLDGGEPIGCRVQIRRATLVIVGVVRNSTSEAFGETPSPVVYTSYRDRPVDQGQIHVRTRDGAETLAASTVTRIVGELDPMLPVYDIRTLSDHVEKNLVLRRIPARMFVVLGPVLLMLAAIGIYGVVAYAVSQRTTEIGVRLALGATARGVVSHIVLETLRLVAAGALVGWLIGLAVNLRVVRGALSVPVFVGVPALLVAVAALSSWLPARRAAVVDPLVALRQE
jgi:putative ABC transport system permease protein